MAMASECGLCLSQGSQCANWATEATMEEILADDRNKAAKRFLSPSNSAAEPPEAKRLETPGTGSGNSDATVPWGRRKDFKR